MSEQANNHDENATGPHVGRIDYHSGDKLKTYVQSHHKMEGSTEIEKDGENEPIWSSEDELVIEYSHEKSVCVFDVAAYIINQTGAMTSMKLQKLIYYCQAWSLVWDETPLFKEPIEAWSNGPVVREMFYFHRGQFIVDSISIGNPQLLSETQIETIDAVLDYYGRKSSQELIDLTHNEEPWKKAREGMSDLQRGHREINLDSIADYFSSLQSEKNE